MNFPRQNYENGFSFPNRYLINTTASYSQQKNLLTLPPRVEYRLTLKGLELLPILSMLKKWDTKYSPKLQNTK
jgi:hypothetical protein